MISFSYLVFCKILGFILESEIEIKIQISETFPVFGNSFLNLFLGKVSDFRKIGF